MGGITGKVWGTTEVLIKTPLIEVHLIRIKPNAKCSDHNHRYKHNAFMPLEGELEIHTRKNDYPLTDVTVLGPGQMTTVKPGENHWFQTGDKPVVAIEIYYCEPLSEDIVRSNCGSVVGA